MKYLARTLFVAHTYQTVAMETESEFKDRGSKFFGYLFPVATIAACKAKISSLKVLHPKAVHHCFAYRLGITKDLFRASDDGEPSGSAGKPILGQIDSAQITDVIIVVVRYWGGTLLGVPGLINAYKTAAQLCIQQATIITKELQVHYKLQYNYTQVGQVMHLLKQVGGVVTASEQQLFCISKIQLPLQYEVLFLELLKDLHNLEYSKIEHSESDN
jgi:uncharacterized YigZ family protein